jgi:hypothetical protein
MAVDEDQTCALDTTFACDYIFDAQDLILVGEMPFRVKRKQRRVPSETFCLFVRGRVAANGAARVDGLARDTDDGVCRRNGDEELTASDALPV